MAVLIGRNTVVAVFTGFSSFLIVGQGQVGSCCPLCLASPPKMDITEACPLHRSTSGNGVGASGTISLWAGPDPCLSLLASELPF